jgi:hypothetical protein
MEYTINKAVFFGKTVYRVFFENTTDPQPYAGLLGNYNSMADAQKAIKAHKK